MRIEIDDKSGFCFGVVTAIAKAEEALAGGRRVASLGDIVHNRMEMKRLEDMGLETVDREQLASLRDRTVLIRAHGEPPETYETARRNGIELVDATCPVVARLQQRVRAAYEQMRSVGGQVVILGKRGHAEVVGLTGQTGGHALVIEGVEDLAQVDFDRPLCLLSQTTQSLSLFGAVRAAILERTKHLPSDWVVIRDTICRQVSNRNPHLKAFASGYDVVLFVSGRQSSNGKALYEACREANPRSYKIEHRGDIDLSWFGGCASVGICGATSTPKWLMEDIASWLRERFGDERP